MIYVITEGTYSDYHICAVATTPERAEELRRMYSDECNVAEIEEYEENVPSYEFFNSNPTGYWLVKFKENGEIIGIEYFFDKPNLSMTVYEKNWRTYAALTVSYIRADSEEKASKIACDARAKYLAEKYNL